VLRLAAEPKRVTWIEAQDHFFEGGLDQLEEAVFETFATRISSSRADNSR
jgi:hypothetical protein